MEKFVVNGGNFLCGSIKAVRAKNSILPIMAASILCEEKVVLKDCPKYSDVENMAAILKDLGAEIKWHKNDLHICCGSVTKSFISTELATKLRSSFFALGALLGRFKNAKVAYPGGCDIGQRPVDLHLKGLCDLNVKIKENHGFIECDASSLCGGVIFLDFPSVGATENLIMAAVLAKGTTTITNCAKEPEIVDLQNFLNKMGAKVCGAGTSVVVVEGVKNLKGCTHYPIADRIFCGTMLVACAMTGGQIEIENCNPCHFSSLLSKLQKTGCKLKWFSDTIKLESSKNLKSLGFLKTSPYPGFPTDLQSQVLALQTICKGSSVIEEKLFESRFAIVPELLKMGAKIKISGQTAYVCGVKKLEGADVFASDLRGGAALVLAGLVAEGYTTIHNIFHIDRGYFQFENTLKKLGAKIERKVD